MKRGLTIVAAVVVIVVALAGIADASEGKHTTVEKHVTVSPAQRITIEGISGTNIIYHSWAKNEISIKLDVTISSNDEEYEKQYISSVKIAEINSDGSVLLRLDETNETSHGGSWLSKLFGHFYIKKDISGDIYVPQSNPLTTDLKYGSITLEDMKGELELLGTSNKLRLRNCPSLKRVENNYGTTDIDNCGGDLRLNGTSSTVTVDDFAGSIRLNADYSTVSVARITGDCTITDKSGKLDVKDIGGKVSLSIDYSTLYLDKVKGPSDIQCTSGKVQCRALNFFTINANYATIEVFGAKSTASEPFFVRSQSGKLDLQDITGNIRIENPYSTMVLARITGDIECNTTSGRIDAENITGDWTTRAQYTTIDVHGLTAKSVLVTNSSNGTTFGLKTVPTTIDIKNDYGAVTVNMPAGFSGNVDMNAEYGKVETNLPVKVKTMSSAAYAVGKVGTGSGTISIETKSANVKVYQGE